MSHSSDYQKTRQTPKSLKRTKGVLNRAEVKYLLALPVNTIHGPQIDSLVSTLSSLKMSKRGKPTRVTHTALVNLRGKLHHREYTRTVWSKEQADITPGALLKEFAIWKALFSWLMTVQEVIPRNPTANVKATKKKPASRKTFIESREDLKRIIDACPPWLQPIVKFAAHTGMRRGEILGLKWAEVDFTNELATLIETKNGDERPVPLNKTALAVVRSIRPKKAKPTDFVFHPGHEVAATRQADDNVSKAFKAVCVRCGYPDITFHDLRRTAGSHMRMTGSDVLTVAEGLGHRDMRTTKRYQRAIPAHLRKAYDLLDEALGDDPPTFLRLKLGSISALYSL